MVRTDEVTRILTTLDGTEGESGRQLLPMVYEELRRLASARLRHEPQRPTMQTTALVHEAYLRIMAHPDCRWENRGHFFGSAAEAMRRILVDRARRRGRLKHGGGRRRRDVDALDPPAPDAIPADLVAIDEALQRLERDDPARSNIVKLRYFAGLSVEQTASVTGLSTATVKRQWRVARAWLCRELLQDREREDG